MSTETARKPRCEAIEAEFVRWSQQCARDAVTIVEVEGDEYWVCADHRSRMTTPTEES